MIFGQADDKLTRRRCPAWSASRRRERHQFSGRSATAALAHLAGQTTPPGAERFDEASNDASGLMQLRYAETRFRMKSYSAGLNALKPSRMGCIPQAHGEFVACTEGVFDLYAETPISARWSALTKARS